MSKYNTKINKKKHNSSKNVSDFKGEIVEVLSHTQSYH